MMLPSGNDAAQTLAIHFGYLIMKTRFQKMKANPEFKLTDLNQTEACSFVDILRMDMNNYVALDERRPELTDLALEEFYDEMNK